MLAETVLVKNVCMEATPVEIVSGEAEPVSRRSDVDNLTPLDGPLDGAPLIAEGDATLSDVSTEVDRPETLRGTLG